MPGAVAFIVVHDGGESDKYKADGLGNAGHVGIITLSGDVYSVDASSSAGKGRSRKTRDAELVWSHTGWLRALDYSSAVVEDEIGGVIMNTIGTATVNTVDGGNLNLRRAPSDNTDNRVGKVPNGTTVEVIETRADGWAKVRFEGLEAWASSRYLLMDAPEQYAPANTPVTIPTQTVSGSPIIVPVRGSGYITISLSESLAYELYNTLDRCVVRRRYECAATLYIKLTFTGQVFIRSYIRQTQALCHLASLSRENYCGYISDCRGRYVLHCGNKDYDETATKG